MSNIYIQEPPTHGKVVLTTSAGEIEVELWSKEAPLACRNFVQLCLESYYDGTVFHRVIPGFIAQGGDPLGTGEGGESIYGKPFKDEFHSRLRFVRRGLVAMANSGPDDNGAQFFFTLGQCKELHNKHTIFGKVAGDTLYNLPRFEEGEIDKDDRPVYPQKINKTEVLVNPFTDIVPRAAIANEIPKEDRKKKKKKGVKNFSLLSFGGEAEEEEALVISANREMGGAGGTEPSLLDPMEGQAIPPPEREGAKERIRAKLMKLTAPETKDVGSVTFKNKDKKKDTDILPESAPDIPGDTSPAKTDDADKKDISVASSSSNKQTSSGKTVKSGEHDSSHHRKHHSDSDRSHHHHKKDKKKRDRSEERDGRSDRRREKKRRESKEEEVDGEGKDKKRRGSKDEEGDGEGKDKKRRGSKEEGDGESKDKKRRGSKEGDGESKDKRRRGSKDEESVEGESKDKKRRGSKDEESVEKDKNKDDSNKKDDRHRSKDKKESSIVDDQEDGSGLGKSNIPDVKEVIDKIADKISNNNKDKDTSSKKREEAEELVKAEEKSGGKRRRTSLDAAKDGVEGEEKKRRRENESEERRRGEKRTSEDVSVSVTPVKVDEEEEKKENVQKLSPEEEAEMEKAKKLAEMRAEIRQLKRELTGKDGKKKNKEEDKEENGKDMKLDEEPPASALQAYKIQKEHEIRNHQQEHHGWPRLAENIPVKFGLRCRVDLPPVRYLDKKRTIPKKGKKREDITLALMEKFNNKVKSALTEAEEKREQDEEVEDGEEEEDDWLRHRLVYDTDSPVLARDASTKDDTWYPLDDPRHPLSRQRREEAAAGGKRGKK